MSKTKHDNGRRARALFDYLLKHRYLMISSVAPAPHIAGQLERAEKRFLLAFVTNTIASAIIILSRVWGLTSPTQLPSLGFGDLLTLVLASAALATTLLAWFAYFEIGISLSVERAVEIKPKDS
jgi:hypothetical protein